MKTLKIAIASDDQFFREFGDTWERAEKGKSPKVPTERLYFEDAVTMFRTLSNTRLHLLSVLRHHGALRIAALARALGRDYKNVYDDVKLLKRFGLIEQGDKGVSVPFDKISMEAEIDLAA